MHTAVHGIVQYSARYCNACRTACRNARELAARATMHGSARGQRRPCNGLSMLQCAHACRAALTHMGARTRPAWLNRPPSERPPAQPPHSPWVAAGACWQSAALDIKSDVHRQQESVEDGVRHVGAAHVAALQFEAQAPAGRRIATWPNCQTITLDCVVAVPARGVESRALPLRFPKPSNVHTASLAASAACPTINRPLLRPPSHTHTSQARAQPQQP